MNPVKQLSRRDFVKTSGLFVLGVSMAGCGCRAVRWAVVAGCVYQS